MLNSKNMPPFLFLLVLSSSICLYPQLATSKPVHNNITDLASLLAFKAQVDDPNGVLSTNWTANTHFCNWIGITCNEKHQRVAWLDLHDIPLQGTISPHLANLSFLSKLDLSNTSLAGHIPNEICQLPRLHVLILQVNNLSGPIPSSLFNMSSLIDVYLPYNNLIGPLTSNVSDIRCPRLQAFSVANNQLTGQIPATFAQCLNLQALFLLGNSLTGSIPSVLNQLPRLQLLALQRNDLSGTLPSSLFNISSLMVIYLSNNNISGSLPSNRSIGRCLQLQIVSVEYNQLTGEIPTSFARCLDLQQLFVSANNLTGSVPAYLGHLPKLEQLSISSNDLSSDIPPSLGNLTNLQLLDIADNKLKGEIPRELGHLSKLDTLYLAFNKLTGSIPESLLNISKVTVIDIQSNNLNGPIPATFGESMPLLERLHLGTNSFSGSLDFITSLHRCRNLWELFLDQNELDGSLPTSVGNLSANLLHLFMAENRITGKIPAELGNLSGLLNLNLPNNELIGVIPRALSRLHNLQIMNLGHNRLGGSIPSELGSMTRLFFISLRSNQFSGAIPDSLGNLTGLQHIGLSNNSISSKIPQSIWKLKGLIKLNLSQNTLLGSIPQLVSNLNALDTLDLSKNQLSGNISAALGELNMLTNLDLSNNSFRGNIPVSLGGLINIKQLDLSKNYLSGAIPKSIANLRYLENLNLSFNMLEGQIPDGKIFSNRSIPSLVGNKALCGAPQLGFQPCVVDISDSHLRRKSDLLRYILPAIALVIALSCMILIFIIYRRRKEVVLPLTDSQRFRHHRIISYHELVRATDNFSLENLLGRGSFGSVFKASLEGELIVAVKVLDLHLEGASKSFDAECQTLCNVRHRNLIKIISICSNLDFKALILQFMPNGSLDQWLHSENHHLNLLQRLNIMVDVALALEYLHHNNPHVVLHCDIKPSNVLLDEDMVAHVSDFGIAKLLLDTNKSIASASMPGTLGYIAPEYGSTGKVSRMGDVYSFGILLLEAFTGKRPTDAMFDGETNLREHIFGAYPAALWDIVDYKLIQECSLAKDRSEIQIPTIIHQCLSSVIELGLLCSSYSPEERIPMVDVVPKLQKIKVEYLLHLSDA